MSVRIKLPAAKVVDSEASQPTNAEPPTRRRKATKRRFAVVSDEEYGDDIYPTTALNSPHAPSPRGRSPTLEPESESEVSPEAHHPPIPLEPSTSRLRRQKPKTAVNGPPNKRKRLNKVLDFDEDYDHAIESNDEEQEAIVDNKLQYKTTKKAKSREEKARSVPDGEPSKKDQTSSQGLPQAKRPQPRNTLKTDSNITYAGEEGGIRPDIHNASHLQPNEPLSLPPKRKLPTIKKNKGALPVATTVSTKLSAAPAAIKNDPLNITEATKPPPIGARKTPASLGNADFDLRNPSVYTALFKTTGGATPRSGLNRREKDDERRKELYKMRDEARAKRLAEMVSSFDLQAQTDKILRFEERLKSNHSSALYPNFLGAKWRELWERDKRRQKEQGWSEERTWGESSEREEGEMNEQPAK